jgi:hypothetical protein
MKNIFSLILGGLLIFLITCTTTDGNSKKIPNPKTIELALREIESVKLPEMERLFSLCEGANIATDYEKVDYTVVKDFVNYVQDDITNRNIARAAYGLNCLEEACKNVMDSLSAYLAGTKKSWEIYRYITSSVDIQGSSLIGQAVNSITGEETVRPLFFIGYGHFDQIVRDMPKMAGYGVNILQNEIGPWDTIIAGSDGGYEINPAGIDRIENILREAEKYNVKVDILLSPHYFPEWVFRKFPYLRTHTGGFLTYNVYEPEAKKVIQAHIIGVMERIKNYKSLNSVCLSNEPIFSTARNFNVKNNNTVVNRMWQQYLADTHGNIESLNSVYKTVHSGFNNVPMPKNIEASPQFYDWLIFNDIVFGDWHQWMAELVHKVAPNIPVHVKIMDAPLSPNGYRTSLAWGVDPERFSEFSQFNGNDSYNLLYNNDGNIVSKMKWYDFLRSMKEIPIYNSEDHIIEDRSQNYVPQQVMHVRSDLWQGAVHGRAASTIWVWERTHDNKSDFAGSILHRPDVVAIVGKTNLDLNRLAHEVTALQNEPASVAILYSKPAKVYDSFGYDAYLKTVAKVYETIIFNGIKPGFITEKQLAQKEWGSYRMIIIPAAVHIMPETLVAIKEFIDSGGKTIVIGENSLSRDVYDREINNVDRTFILINSKVLKNDGNEISSEIRKIFIESGLCNVTLWDNNTGNPVSGVEWLSTECNGKLLINICNYEWGDSKSVSVLIYDKPSGNVQELISGNVIDAANIELVPYTPVLLCINL